MSGTIFTTDPKVCLDVRMGSTPQSKVPSTTVMARFDDTCSKHGDSPAIHQKVDGMWETHTWNQYRAKVDSFAKGLMSVGFQVSHA